MPQTLKTISLEDAMSVNGSDPETVLADLIATDDADNEAIEFEPARLNLEVRAVEI